jgi:hypothetical protein
MEKQIHLVSEGCYSDYRIVAAFSTKEAAEAYAAELRKIDDDAGVETYPIDSVVGETARRAWTAVVDLRGGLIYGEQGDDRELRVMAQLTERGRTEIVGRTEAYPDGVGANVTSFVSAEHARKLAAEAHQSYLRKQAVIASPS